MFETAVNRLLPYRGLHTDLVAHERYYTFNDPATADPIDMTAWTVGVTGEIDEASDEYGRFDGRATHSLGANLSDPWPSTYVQSSVTNIDAALPCTFRVVMRGPLQNPYQEPSNREGWVRIYDPADANTDVWFHFDSTIEGPNLPDPTGAVPVSMVSIGTVGSDVIDARVTNPIPGMTNNGSFSSSSYEDGGVAGDCNHFAVCEFELPAAASRTMRIQLVDDDGATTLTTAAAPLARLLIARAEVLQGKVSRWTCRRTGRTFSQPTPSLQPYARPMGVPQFNGRRVLFFNNVQHMVSDDPPETWSFLNSGEECSVYAAFMPTAASSGYVLSTSGPSPNDGWRLFYEHTTNEVTVGAANASGTSIFASIGSAPRNTLFALGYRALDGHADGDAIAEFGGATLVANASNWGAASPPSNTLYIGARPPGAIPWDGYIADVVIYDVRLEDEEHARAIEELESWNACAASIPGLILSCTADFGFDPDTEVWKSRVGDVALEPLLGGVTLESPPQLRGSLGLVLAETQDIGNYDDDLITDLNSDHAVIACMQVLSDTSSEDVLWDLRNSAALNTYEWLAYSGGQWVYTRRSNTGSTDTFTGGTADLRSPHVHSFVLASGERSAWVDGSPLFENVASNPGTMTGVNQVLVGRGHTAGSGAHCMVAEYALYNVAPNDYQRQLVERAMRRRMLGLDRLGDSRMKLGIGIGLGHTLGRATAPPLPPVIPTPDEIESVFAWWQPGLALTQESEGGDGDPITGMPNLKTGGSTDMDLVVNGTAPLRVDGATPNGGVAVSLDGIDDHLRTASTVPSPETLQVHMLVKFDDAVGDQPDNAILVALGSTQTMTRFANSTGYRLAASGAGFNAAGHLGTDWVYVSCCFDGASGSIQENGVDIGTGTIGALQANTRFTFGSVAGVNNDFLRGRFGAMAVSSEKLAGADLAKMIAWMASV